MRLELNKGFYKSIMPFVWDNIPDFVVMTGQNGTGKTQLLELINHHLGATEITSK